MDKASVFGTEDCRFESYRGHFSWFSSSKKLTQAYMHAKTVEIPRALKSLCCREGYLTTNGFFRGVQATKQGEVSFLQRLNGSFLEKPAHEKERCGNRVAIFYLHPADAVETEHHVTDAVIT